MYPEEIPLEQLAIKDLLCNFESGLERSTGVEGGQRALFGGNNYIFKVNGRQEMRLFDRRLRPGHDALSLHRKSAS